MKSLAAIILACLATIQMTSAIEVNQFAGAAHAYPAMVDLEGKELANGEFTQELANGLLRIRITYDLSGGDRIEEEATFEPGDMIVRVDLAGGGESRPPKSDG